MTEQPSAEDRLVGVDRVLAVLVQLAQHPTGATLDDLAHQLNSPKASVHRALGALRRARLATQPERGLYVLGDEFLRLAHQNQAGRPDGLLMEPLLRDLAERYGETAHYAVLDGADVVYRAKVDPTRGAVRLSSVVGGRNPAHRTAVGKLLLSTIVQDERELRDRFTAQDLVPRTPRSITSIEALWKELLQIRDLGYAVDDQENEVGVNCIAVPAHPDLGGGLVGAVSISALAFRTPLSRLVADVPQIMQRVRGV